MVRIEIDSDSIELIKLTDEEYFSSKYKDYISNSKLSLLNPEEGGSFEKFENGFNQEYSSSFELGSAVHAMVLQPDEYEISDLDKPNSKLGLFTDQVLKLRRSGMQLHEAFKQASVNADYYAKSFTENRLKKAIKEALPFYLKRYKINDDENEKEVLYLSKTIKDKYEQCIKGISNNSRLMSLLIPDEFSLNPFKSFNEYAIFCKVYILEDDEIIDEVLIKAKLDNFTIDLESKVITLNDLKTTGKQVKSFMSGYEFIDKETKEKVKVDGSFTKYRYYRQMGMYLWLLNAAMTKIYNDTSFTYKSNMLVVETIPEFNSMVFEVSKSFIVKGMSEMKQLLYYYAIHKRYN